MEELDESFKSLLELGGLLEQVIFKEFFIHYDFPEGLNRTHMMTLMMLKFEGAMPMSEMSLILNLEKGSFTPVANRLIKHNYINKKQSLKDKRVYELSLSEYGEEITEKFRKSHHVYVNELIESIDEEKREKFLESADFMRRIFAGIAKNSSDEYFKKKLKNKRMGCS